MSNGYNLNYKNYIPQKLNSGHYLIGFLFLILFIGLGSLVGWYYYTDSNISNCSDYYKQQTKKDWSDCKDPGGKQNASTCNCDCNPGYEGVNCQTKKKHVTDLETACKDKTGKACGDCLKTNIEKNLSGSGTDVQQFKDDFVSSITAINNICCQNNCSNTSGTACDKCVETNDKDTTHIFGDKTYEINSKGCISYWTKDTSGGITRNNIAENNICNKNNPNSPSPESKSLPKCPIGGGIVSDKNISCEKIGTNNVGDFAHLRWGICPNISGYTGGNTYKCRGPSNKEYTSGKKHCITDTTKPCILPNSEKAKTLFNTSQCKNMGWPTSSTKCQCPGSIQSTSKQPFYVRNLKYYSGDNCENYCDPDPNVKSPKGCP